MSSRGQLRVYLGAAPGVGKTYAMLDEGHRRASRGTDVVAAFVETHARQHTEALIEGLELIPRRAISYRGSQFTELDLQAVLARAPEVALVDELAHTNVPGSEHEKRWQDVETILEAGIDVISTVNIQHLESLNDVVEAITGVAQRETVPDAAVRAAEQVELVDMTPEALRRRMAHGNIYKPDKVDAALANYFRPPNLTALRELALLWLADSVEEGLKRYREQHGIAATWETRERVVVAVTGGPEGETLIRRAGRIAVRVGAGDLLAVHVARSDGLTGSSVAALEQQRLLVESLGGSYHSIVGDDVATSVLDFARANNATQIVIGASRRNPALATLTGLGRGVAITRRAGTIDVHVVSHDYIGRGWRLPALTGGLTVRQRLTGLLVGVLLLALLLPLCAHYRADLTLSTDVMLFLLVVVIVSVIGGFYPAMLTAFVNSLLLNYYFVPPIHTFTISQPQNVLALVVFLVIAALVSRVVDRAARRTTEAARSSAEAETLSALAGSLLRGEQALPALLDRVRETFGVTSVSLLRCDSDAPASTGGSARTRSTAGMRGTWSCVGSVGDDPPLRPEDGDAEVPIGEDLDLALRGRKLAAEDQRLLAAFAAQVAVAYRQRELSATAGAAESLAAANRIRTALLNAVSHDLRTPIASAKAAVSSVLSSDIAWSEDDRRELLTDANSALDRLTVLVTNLLDMSRLDAGVLSITEHPIGVDDVVSRSLQGIPRTAPVDLDVPDTLPEVLADPGLLERVLANLIENALRYTPPERRVLVAASSHGGQVEIRVIDRGPGIAPEDREAVFAPFQRRDDHSSSLGPGVGLGLAIARGFVAAMHGSITLDDTPGGGLTVVVALPTPSAAEGRSPAIIAEQNVS